jgi:hypothetical protein
MKRSQAGRQVIATAPGGAHPGCLYRKDARGHPEQGSENQLGSHVFREGGMPPGFRTRFAGIATLAAATLGLLVVGAMLAWWAMARTDHEQRADLLRQTQLVAQTLDAARIKRLTGTEADLGKPEYLRVRGYLADMRAAYPHCRAINLLSRRADGTLFFLIGSEPAGSKDSTQPGQVYSEASEALRDAFSHQRGATGGPQADHRGRWVQGLVPILDPQATLATLAVVVLEMDAQPWHRRLVRSALPPAGLTFALLALLWLGAGLGVRRDRLGEAAPQWLQHLGPGLVVAAGLLLTSQSIPQYIRGSARCRRNRATG